MPAPKKDAQANEMYDLYRKGYSLAQVAKAFGKGRQSVYGLFQSRKFVLRSKPTPLPFIIFGGKKYTIRACGYYGMTNGSRHYLHRDVWESIHGPIPPDHDVHHKNEDVSDNRIENLEMMRKADHARHHARLKGKRLR